ncbi:MAG: site-specific integrase [Candidatus Obscuribacterales bacterium]|nr:site-specific integrase [Candidatus Obscuribacterales bacterium]
MTIPSLGAALQSFLIDHLEMQKGLRRSSITSYRDTLRLFLQYVGKSTGRAIVKLTLPDLTCEHVLGFLNSMEKSRGNSIRTRNQRLAAIHTFYKHLSTYVPEMISESQRIAAIPAKRTNPPETIYLDHDDITNLFKHLPIDGRRSLRDRTLLLFLYNTGARVQEVAELTVESLDFGKHPKVRLHGKGDKWRTCPLWQDTAESLKLLIDGGSANSPVFVSVTGQALTRFGIYKIVRKLSAAIATSRKKNISPHVYRHSCAVHLLESGVDVNVIRGWLGHVSLDTTNRYAEINIRMKCNAMELCEPPATSKSRKQITWKNDETLLKWLQSL